MLAQPIENSANAPLWEHLGELRLRLFQCVLSTFVLMCGAYYFSDDLVRFIELPLLKHLPAGQQNLYYTGLTDKVFVYLKVSFLTAVALNVPVYLYQIWKFVEPGLKTSERNTLFPFLVFGSIAFSVGIMFCYTVVLPTTFRYLLQFGATTEKPIITLSSYFELTLQLLLAMGVLFEVPVVLVLLARLGWVNSRTLIRYRRYFLFINSIFSALVTPSPDLISLAMVMVPIALLYEIGIIAVLWMERTLTVDKK